MILFYVFARYRYPLAPLLMPFAAAGIVAAYDLVRSLDGRAFRELAMGMALAGAAAVACNWPLPPAADTDVETTWIGVGTALLDADEPAGAIDAFRRALAVRESPAAYNNLGLAYRAAGNLR